MAIIKCKMCGGDLNIVEGSTVAECAYCGTKQTVPSADSEKKLTLFARAGRLLRACEFDKAAGVFEAIAADFPEEAEAYWGLVLCKYGIEYVDDPATGKKIPTCHRSSFDSVLDDPNFEQACENTDAVARRVYRDEARQIEELRQAILQVSGREEPYDVFISYKETDENGDRTLDSVIAQDIYTELTEKGYRVFFSRISLEDKLGTEYEPYIFAALNSAKVMLVVGTDYENFDSVWVKNEWSRFLKLIAAGQKKTLIPVFKNMDAYDMPKEFAKLAAQDMGKVGAMQDLVRGVGKIVGKNKRIPLENPEGQQRSGQKIDVLIRRGDLLRERGIWESAAEFYNDALNIDPECAAAYWGIFLIQHQCRDEADYYAFACASPKPERRLLREDTAHIAEMAKTHSVPGFLSEEEIAKQYHYEEYWDYSEPVLKKLMADELQVFDENPNIVLAFRFATGSLKTKLDQFKETLTNKLLEQIEKNKEHDLKEYNRKKDSYKAFLSYTDIKVKKMELDAQKAREAAYQDAVSKAESAGTAEEIHEVIETLQKQFARDKEAGACCTVQRKDRELGAGRRGGGPASARFGRKSRQREESKTEENRYHCG